jgi:hypothetical protein
MTSSRSPRAALLVAVLAATPACSLTYGQGFATRAPDNAPVFAKVSGRGPISRDGWLLAGVEGGLEYHGKPIRQGSVLLGARLRDPELGTHAPAVEVAGALGLGRGNFDPEAEHLGVLTGARFDVPIPIYMNPSAESSKARAFYFGVELVPYAHGDVIWRSGDGDVVEPGAELGLGVRVTGGTDMTLMDAVRQVF